MKRRNNIPIKPVKKNVSTPIFLELSNYVKPTIVEQMGKDWVLNGPGNSFFQYVIDRRNGSPTNCALIDAYVDRIFGKGISEKNQNTDGLILEDLMGILPQSEAKKIVSDFYLFGSAVGQVRYGSGSKRKIAKIEHLDRQMTAPNKVDDKGDINYFWVSRDFGDVNSNKPKRFPAFGTSKEDIEIFEIKPYRAGKTYFADPSYIAGLQYANLEEEISNFSINHIKNGLSAGFLLNFNNGIPEEEQQVVIERKVNASLVGSPNAGRIVLNFNDSKETAPSIEAIPTNANHEQWQFWADEARQQLIVAHRVTTPMLFGVKDNTGFGNNANEMEEGTKLLHETAIRPKQNEIIEVLQKVVNVNGNKSPIVFVPLEDEQEKIEDNNKSSKIEEIDKAEETELSLASEECATFLLERGESIDLEEWELIEERPAVSHTLSESKLINIFRLAVSGDARKSSEQDTSIFRIRYEYAGSMTPERTFCRQLILANKVYRAEDLEEAENKVVNKGFGPNGADKYSIWLYKGGVNCEHWWKRVIYLKKGNTQIGVNKARKLILELEPSEREAAKWEQNDPKVAVIASPSNNNWKLN